MKLSPSDHPSITEISAQPPRVPDLVLPHAMDRVLIQRMEYVQFTRTARWTGAYWIFEVQIDGESVWVRETAEEGTYEEISPEPNEEPSQPPTGSSGPVPG